jgi:hypothetical protein
VDKGYFEKGVCHPPQGEKTLNPGEGECIVFHDIFVAGLRLPLNPIVHELLVRFKVKIHQLTPNAILQQSKFWWVVKTFGRPIYVDALSSV